MNINDRTGCSKNTAFPETWKNGDLTASLSVYIYIYPCIFTYNIIYIYICINTYNICVKITKGRLAPKLPSCGGMSRGSLVIMSTTEGARAVRA